MTSKIDVSFAVNGEEVRGSVEPRMTLADFLRDEVGLTGTHLGCEHGVCGACTILVNGHTARSCLMLAVQADGQELTTVEGLESADGTLHPVQEAFSRHHALQCGFCTPGFLMNVVEYLEEGPSTEEKEIRERMSGNLCRCTGYHNIVLAVKELAERQT
ncbi:MAG: (2Fe-2S)-binding protein [Acidimicrobiia bacterium]